MYVHPAFAADLDQAARFLAERGFGTLIAQGPDGPVAAHVPFLFDPAARRIELHVARANPIHGLIAADGRVLLTCVGPDAYISPDWYASANQVSTWTYVAVHAAGTARLLPPEHLRGHLDRLSAHFEAQLLPKKPWTADKMEPQRLTAMMTAIVGIEIEDVAVTGQWKLNQHKNATDHAAVTAALRAAPREAARAVAELMDAARR